MAAKWVPAFAATVLSATAAEPPSAWNDKATPDALDKLWHEVPAPVRPAIEFQKLLLQIRHANKVEEWRAEVEKVAQASGDDPVIRGLREFAKTWLARASMEEIDGALRKFYRREVRFPDSLSAVQSDIPAGTKLDPWGEAWVYKVTAPKGFTKLVKQRYQLGPTRYPQLSRLADAVKPKPAPQGWHISPRSIGTTKALEMRASDGKVAVVEPGGRFADATLLFIGEGWALLADTEWLFTLAF